MIELTNHLDEIAEGIRSLSQSVDQRRLKNARSLARAGEYTQACQEIEGHNFSEPRQRVEAVLLLAKVFAQQGEFDKASAYWKQVLRVDSENKEALSGLAAISTQYSHPPLQRVWGFVVGSMVLITLTALLVLFINSRFQDVDSRIVSTSTDTRDFTLERSSQITEAIQTLQRTYADELAVATAGINTLKERVVRAEEQAVQREQVHSARFNSTFAEVRNGLSRNRKALGIQLNSLETNTTERISTLSQEQEKLAAQTQERLGKLESSLASFGEKIQRINMSVGARDTQDMAQRKSLENRLRAMEQQLSSIQEILLQINPRLSSIIQKSN